MRIEVLENGALYRVWTPAKINLFFEILGKRPDGYHGVETLVAPISLYDRLDCYFSESDEPEITLECLDADGRPRSDVPTDGSNLVAKAYRVYCEEMKKNFSYNKFPKAHVKIFKKIPTKAGLGGGSSDAAGFLSVLKRLGGVRVPQTLLFEAAGRLGSDVALFLEESASIGRGRGELVEPFKLPKLWAAIVKPSFGLSTSDVYRRYSTTVRSPKRSLDDVLSSIRQYDGDCFAEFMSRLIFNRLEEPASFLWDGVERWKSTLNAFPETLVAQMSGSGTAFFALCSNEENAKRVANSVRDLCRQNPVAESRVEDVFVVQTL